MIVAAVLAASFVAPVVASVGTASAATTIVEMTKPTPGPRGAIAVIGDSVMVGSVMETSGWGPSVQQLLVDRGWGPIRVRAGVGFQTGRSNPSDPANNLAVWLYDQRRSGFDPPVVAVNLGANDIKACRGSSTCALANVRYLMDVVGPGRQVWWPLITMTDQAEANAWNSALQLVASQRSNLVIWDWPAAQVANGVTMSSDRIHLANAAAYRQRSRLMADDISARVGAAQRVGGGAALPAPSTPLEYRPISPQRLADTRTTGGRLPSGGVLTIDVDALAPAAADAGAVAVNVTAAGAASAGGLTVWPCGASRPTTANVQYGIDNPRGGHTTSLLGAGGMLCVFSSAPTDVIVDLQGVFAPSGGTRFTPSAPARVLDTRNTGRQAVLAIAAPAGATAVALTVTVTGSAAGGFLTAYPCGTQPPVVSNLNFSTAETVAGAAFVPVGPDGRVCVYTNVPVDVIVDVTGTFSAGGGLRFVPVTSTKTLDTRDGTGGWRGVQAKGQVLDIVAAPAGAVAVTGTITMVAPFSSGYLTGSVCGAVAGQTSSVNAAQGQTMATSLTVALSAGGTVCINSFSSTHTLFDTTGWWTA
jgi:lysophospholipase L1-like esterase